jgi:hypothetical protein
MRSLYSNQTLQIEQSHLSKANTGDFLDNS